MSESFLSKHKHLESVDVGKAEVGVEGVRGWAFIGRHSSSYSTLHGDSRGLKVCHHRLKPKSAPASK